MPNVNDLKNPMNMPSRRLFVRAAAVTTALVVSGAGSYVAAQETDTVSQENFAFTLTNNEQLSAETDGLSERAKELIRIGEVGIAGGDRDALAAFFHPDFRFHGPGGAELRREELWDYFALCRDAFDDFSVTRQTLMSDGTDHLAARTTFAGVFARRFEASPIGPLEPTGKAFDYQLINIFRYAPNGQLAEEWVQNDTRGFLQSLGVEQAPTG